MPDLAGWVGKSMVVGVSHNLDLDHCVPKSLGPAEVYGMLFYVYVGREKQHFGLWDVFGMVFPGNKKLEPHTSLFVGEDQTSDFGEFTAFSWTPSGHLI